MADDVSLDTGSGLKDNRRTFSTDESNNVHTLRTTLSLGGAPIDSDNPLPVGDSDVLAQLVVANTALFAELKRLRLAVECIEKPMRQMVSHLELITDEVFHLEDMED